MKKFLFVLLAGITLLLTAPPLQAQNQPIGMVGCDTLLSVAIPDITHQNALDAYFANLFGGTTNPVVSVQIQVTGTTQNTTTGIVFDQSGIIPNPPGSSTVVSTGVKLIPGTTYSISLHYNHGPYIKMASSYLSTVTPGTTYQGCNGNGYWAWYGQTGAAGSYCIIQSAGCPTISPATSSGSGSGGNGNSGNNGKPQKPK